MTESYKVVQGEDGLIRFITDSHLTYWVAIRQVPYFNSIPEIGDFLYELSFDYSGSPLRRLLFAGRYDQRISATITVILTNFFEQLPDGILTFTCDSQDKRQRQRRIAFSKWYKTYGTDRFAKIDGQEYDAEESLTYYFSILFRKNHPYQSIIVDSFNQLEEEFQSTKDR